ncbi:hypothetical protein IAT38_003168 [Cryptococcus sp. DSM 104549]
MPLGPSTSYPTPGSSSFPSPIPARPSGLAHSHSASASVSHPALHRARSHSLLASSSSVPPSYPHLGGGAGGSSSTVPPPRGGHGFSLPIGAFARADTHAIKQELHDALGAAGLPYWKALNGYLVGQIARGELEGMVRGWLKGDKLHLHNKLLVSLLNNAAAPTHLPASSTHAARKRKRVGVDDPEFDIDDTVVEPKLRVQAWVMGMGAKERARVKRVLTGAGKEAESEAEVRERGKWSLYSSNTLVPPLALPKRAVPSSHQLALRLSQFAKTHDLSIAPNATDDIGEFMAVGMNAHLADILHGVVHLTGRDRPGDTTIRVPTGGTDGADRLDGLENDGYIGPGMSTNYSYAPSSGSVPPPDLETLQCLFALHPQLHPHLSPALHRLSTAQTLAELELNDPKLAPAHRKPVWIGGGAGEPPVAGLAFEEDEQRVGVAGGRAPSRSQAVETELMGQGLLKLDKSGRQSEVDGGEGKKDKKHSLHWKYEDPAMILKDVLG